MKSSAGPSYTNMPQTLPFVFRKIIANLDAAEDFKNCSQVCSEWASGLSNDSVLVRYEAEMKAMERLVRESRRLKKELETSKRRTNLVIRFINSYRENEISWGFALTLIMELKRSISKAIEQESEIIRDIRAAIRNIESIKSLA